MKRKTKNCVQKNENKKVYWSITVKVATLI